MTGSPLVTFFTGDAVTPNQIHLTGKDQKLKKNVTVSVKFMS